MSNPHKTAGSPTVVSLYSGAGGLDLGFAQAGMRLIFANDIDDSAVETHRNLSKIRDPRWIQAADNHRGCSVASGDVRDLRYQFHEGMSDVVIGGPPCQGFSVAGKMDPNDPRSKHVFDFLAIVSIIKPKVFVMENVAALAQNRRWRHVIRTLQEHASVNYDTELFVLNSADWGVPQSRKRMFLIGVERGLSFPQFGLDASTVEPQTVRSALSEIPSVGSSGNDSLCTARITLAKKPILRRSPFAGMLFNGQGRVIDLDRPAPTLPASMGGNRTPIIDQQNLDDPERQPWIVEYHDRLFRKGLPPFDEIPDGVNMRRLTVQEAAAIQSFPNDMPWAGSQSAQFRQIGNAVPPKLAYVVATHVMQVLQA